MVGAWEQENIECRLQGREVERTGEEGKDKGHGIEGGKEDAKGLKGA